jgi:peptide chain release factor 3
LQFDVVEARLQHEYGVKVLVEPLPYTHVRWLGESPADEKKIDWPYSGILRARDRRERQVCMFGSKWTLDHFVENNPGLVLSETG